MSETEPTPIPILDGPKPAPDVPLPPEPLPDPRATAEREDPLAVEANLDAARDAARQAREAACAQEVAKVLDRHRCTIRPKLDAILVPMGADGNGATMAAAVRFSGFDVSSR